MWWRPQPGVRIKVEVTITSTGEDGGVQKEMKRHIFTMPHPDMIEEETATPLVGIISHFFGIPRPASLIQKVVESARHVVPAPGEGLSVEDLLAGRATMLAVRGNMPLTTIRVAVDHGVVVSVTGDFEDVKGEEEAKEEETKKGEEEAEEGETKKGE